VGKMRNFLRHMRTTQERRRGEADADRGVPPRACRNATNLPNYWMDFWRRPQRSWKAYRRRWRWHQAAGFPSLLRARTVNGPGCATPAR
jgi:hypothetical protein